MKIEKEATGIRNSRNFVFFTDSCRDGIKQVLRTSSNPTKILLPAYVGLSLVEGSGILDPVKESGTEFDFYEVDSNLDPELTSLESQIIRFNPTHVLLVNYFGFLIGNRESAFSIMSKYPVCVIEDFAHLIEPLRDHQTISMKASYEVYSLHKIIGTGLGGGALVSDIPNLPMEDTIPKSSLLHYTKSDLNYISKIRWRNFNYLEDKIDWNSKEIFTRFFSDGRRPIIPLNFPIKLSSKDLRHKLYEFLTGVKIFPTALYHRLVPEITQECYPISMEIANTVLNLPIHQDIGPKELNLIIKAMQRFCDDE